MEREERGVGEPLGAIDDLGGAAIGGARLALLLVGEAARREREQLVDLGAVEGVARALGGDLRVIVEHDGRRQEEVARSRLAGEHREEPGAVAVGGRGGGRGRRIEQRHELAAGHGDKKRCAPTSEDATASSRGAVERRRSA